MILKMNQGTPVVAFFFYISHCNKYLKCLQQFLKKIRRPRPCYPESVIKSISGSPVLMVETLRRLAVQIYDNEIFEAE